VAPTDDKVGKAIDVLHRNAALQARLIEDLLDVSRAAGGQLSIQHRMLDLGQAVRSVLELSHASAEANGVALTWDLPDESPMVLGDEDRIHQILSNVVGNAVKFTPEGGRVHVSLERGAAQAVIVVRDTGIGIDPGFLPHVFEEFRQADATTTRAYGGLGIGLTIVRELVRLHGGTVAVDSDGEGYGTTVRVAFPIAGDSSATGDGVSRVREAEARGAA
jgi:signal transduction histidine kinase